LVDIESLGLSDQNPAISLNPGMSLKPAGFVLSYANAQVRSESTPVE
jgi:hypothetical protein